MRALLNEGDRLISISLPGEDLGRTTFKVGTGRVSTIGVHELPGPMGNYLVANITFDTEGPDRIVPLHMALHFEVLNP
jgi:hypothetical protein